MAVPKQKFYEMTFQLLFALDMGDSLEGDLIPFLMRELAVTRKTVREAYQKAHALFEMRTDLDAQIAAISEAYALERIQRVERNVLRLAFYDLMHEDDEREQIISAALNLTRKFSTKEATKYVNAILDSRPSLSAQTERAS